MSIDLDSGAVPRRRMGCGVYIIEKEDMVNTSLEIGDSDIMPPVNPHLIKDVSYFSSGNLLGVDAKYLPFRDFNVLYCHGRDSGVDRWPFPGEHQGRWMLRPRIGVKTDECYAVERNKVEPIFLGRTIPDLVRSILSEGEQIFYACICNDGGYDLGIEGVIYNKSHINHGSLCVEGDGLCMGIDPHGLVLPPSVSDQIAKLREDPHYLFMLKKRDEKSKNKRNSVGDALDEALKYKNDATKP